MSTYTGPEAADLFQRYLALIGGESDRGAVLVAASLLDEALERLLRAKLILPAKKSDPLFDGGFPPLRSFAAKIELAFRLGLITRETRGMLDLFRDLRNKFAHGSDPVSLGDQDVKDRLAEIFARHASLHRALVGTFAEVLKDHPDAKLTLEEFVRTKRGQRAVFDTFFAANAMALHRTALDVERTEELTPNVAGDGSS